MRSSAGPIAIESCLLDTTNGGPDLFDAGREQGREVVHEEKR